MVDIMELSEETVETKDVSMEMEDTKREVESPVESGMANVFAKILAKKVRSVPILAKAPKRGITDESVERKPAKPADFDVVKPGSSSDEGEKYDETPKKPRKKKLRQEERNNLCRGKPNPIADREKERNLVRLATKGVVQLFNAVKASQSAVEEQMSTANLTERSKEKILKHVTKGEFFKLSSKGKSSEAKVETKKEPVGKWKVLQDDFLGDPSLKDWDKQDLKQE